jgi:chorismate dehydratase
VNVAKVLLKEYWKKDVNLVDASGEDFRSEIKGNTAGVVIGDRALMQRQISTYIYDLAEAWKAYTGLPFVFAAWIANKELPPAFKTAFNEANGIGLSNLDKVVAENVFPYFDLKEYYTRYISYDLNDEKRKGLELFLEKLKSYNK